MTVSGADRDEERQETGGTSDQWRPPTAAFLPSFVALRDAVNGACEQQTEWEAKVAAGIRAALEFAAADPAAVHALTIDARRQPLGDDNRADEVVRYFAAMLGKVAPAEMRFPVSTDQGTVEAIAMVIRGRLLEGTTIELPALAPDFIYLALMPYTGLSEARRWTESLLSL